MKYLSLYFDAGPLQSWGYGSYKKNRTTKLFPTQSAVTGIICAASGNYINKIGVDKSRKYLKKINEGKFYSLSFNKNNIMTDFQTIGTNYVNDQVYKADFKPHNDTVIINKQYTENGVSGCIIEHEDEDFLNEIANCLKSPLSSLGIGRSCCIPASPIFNSVNNSLKDAFLSLINRVNLTRKAIQINDDSIIKIVFPSIDGSPINDIMIGHQQFVSRLIKEEDRTLKEWKIKLLSLE